VQKTQTEGLDPNIKIRHDPPEPTQTTTAHHPRVRQMTRKNTVLRLKNPFM
jgi:hypothetical protein